MARRDIAPPSNVEDLPALKAPATKGRKTWNTDTNDKHIWVITGPAGCGKTSVAEHLHNVFGLPYLEGDSFHTPANVAKMRAGTPLTDADRWDWLADLRDQALSTLFPPETTASTPLTPSHYAPTGVLLTCSALRRAYRDILRSAAQHLPVSDPNVRVRVYFIYLSVKEEVVLERVAARQGHYMKADMVRSQFESLEVPGDDEVVTSVQMEGETTGNDVFDVDSCQEQENVCRDAQRAMETMIGFR